MWSKSVSTALGGQRWNSEGIGPQSCSQRSRMVILLLAQHYLLHTSQLHWGNVDIKYFRLDLSTRSTMQFKRRPFFCFARFADSALEDYATRCLCHICSSQSDTPTECQKYVQNSFCQISLSLSWLFSTELCRVCSRWTLDRQSKSRRDNSSRLASCLL